MDIQKEECVPKAEGGPPNRLGVVSGSWGTGPEVGDQKTHRRAILFSRAEWGEEGSTSLCVWLKTSPLLGLWQPWPGNIDMEALMDG